LVQVDPSHSGGLFARAKIAETSLGDETLALAEEDMLSPSVGYRIKEKSDINIHHRTRLREVMRAFLDHVSLVGYPAYRGAQVLAVREEQLEPAGDLPPGRKALDEAYANPTYLWALERLNS
jgi:HK97 family phage prohead protease